MGALSLLEGDMVIREHYVAHADGAGLLSLFVFAPVVGLLVVLFLPAKRQGIIKTVAAAAAAVPLAVGFYVFFYWQRLPTGAGAEIHFYERYAWITSFNIYYTMGIDGLSAPMVVLSGLIGFLAVVSSWGIEKQSRGYFALLLLLLTGMNGVFCALDFFLFYVFWEVMLLPMYFLIGLWGGPSRVYAAIKFFLYTMAGSLLILVALIAMWYWSDGSLYAQYLYLKNEKGEVVAVRGATPEHRRNKLDEVGCDIYLDYHPRDRLRQRQLREQLRQLEAEARVARGAAPVDLAAAEKLQQQADQVRTELEEEKQRLIAYGQELALQPWTSRTFDLLELRARWRLFVEEFHFLGWKPHFGLVMFLLLFVGFAIKVPIFPFHTWLPWAHVEAPTAVSVILAGILLKMGVYGFLRVSYSIFPTYAVYFAVPLALLGVINIFYGAYCAMAQEDMKKLVAYSSVSHMGYCLLGLAAGTATSLQGCVLQMFSHGCATGMMFLLVGVIYDRAHHRRLGGFGGLASRMPVYAGIMTVGLFASMGLPGLSGFIAEILVLIGSFRSGIGDVKGVERLWDMTASFQTLTVLAALGVIITAAYLLWMMQRMFFGELNPQYATLPDMNGRELFSLVPLVIVVILFGVYPQPLIQLTADSCEMLSALVSDANNLELLRLVP